MHISCHHILGSVSGYMHVLIGYYSEIAMFRPWGGGLGGSKTVIKVSG